MGFSCVEKQGFLYQPAGYKSKPVLAEKEELYFLLDLNKCSYLAFHNTLCTWEQKKDSWLRRTQGSIFWSVEVASAGFTLLAVTCILLAHGTQARPHSRKSVQNILNRFPQICSLLVLCLTAGSLLQHGHEKKAKYHRSKHFIFRSYCLPRKHEAKPIPSCVKRTTSRAREVFIPFYLGPSILYHLSQLWKSKRILRNWKGPSRRRPGDHQHMSVEERLK